MLCHGHRLSRSMSLLLITAASSATGQDTQSVPAPKPPLKISFEKRSVPIVGEIRDGWEQTITLPDTLLTSGERLVLGVADGWLRARHESPDGQFDWQFILCRIKEGILPEVFVRDGLPFVEVTYDDGRYFIRESHDFLRCLRETGADIASPFSKSVFSANVLARGTARSNVIDTSSNAWEDEQWFFVALGPQDGNWNTVVRLNPMELSASGFGVKVMSAGHIHYSHGKQWLIDDGNLLVAFRTRPAVFEAEKKREAARKAILSGGKLPPMDATAWLNTDEPLTWESLRGKVVLLDFWGTWCGPCVAKLPGTQSLHEKYADRGLVVLGIHSEQGGDECAAFVDEHGYTFPMAVDTGKTAEAFAVEAWPTYFLIDRSGKVVEGFAHNAPADDVIEPLLDQPSAD